MLQNFRSYQMAKDLYSRVVKLKGKYYLKNQMERAALSVVLNLAEGAGRRQTRDKARFYTIALGSLRELQAALDVMNEQKIFLEAGVLGAHIYNLIKSTKTQKPSSLTTDT